MLFPRKMKYVELTVLKSEADIVLEYLGKKGLIQFFDTQAPVETHAVVHLRAVIERLLDAGIYIGAEKAGDTSLDEEISLPDNEDKELADTLCSKIEILKELEYQTIHEKQRIRETINEARAFSKMNLPFSDFEHLSYLTLRIGRIDPKGSSELRENLGNRAVIIPLDDNRIIAACSKKGRFALDSHLKKLSFEPVVIGKNYRGIPAEMMKSLNEQHINLEKELEKIKNEKEILRLNCASDLERLVLSMNTMLTIEGIKGRFTSTENLYHFSGWIIADTQAKIVKDLTLLTGGRAVIHSCQPHDVPSVKNGIEKVPVAMKHNAFVKGFESMVFSYGAPLYGTIDPTPIVAFFFTLMFGIMFGDVGQGLVLLLAGIFIKKSKKTFVKFSKFSIPLISVGISSIIMGFLAGSFFTNEKILIAPTRVITKFITGEPMDRILHILPMAGEAAEGPSSITKLLYFFGFTVAIGVIINSLGLIINIYNRCVLKKYQAAFFSKTGLSGLLLFWYALFLVVRLIFGGQFELYDITGLLIPSFCIFFGPVIWRFITREKPVLENGLFTFIIEGFVEIMETVITYVSNTISFLRVGAFALAHAVFSFIVFYFTDELASSGIAGTFSAALIMIFGNAVIILLEGLIVAIQVIRLQYYEFFNKFFVETGAEFAPFRFTSKKL
ncbi:MAG: V-type ATP synthase subunit I [Treponema sp.]|nr:V-type ATP synthase subunit I [Treponema sp.]